MRASSRGVAASSHKRWIYILGGLAIIILGLLMAILWRIFTPGTDKETQKTALAQNQKVVVSTKPVSSDEALIKLITSYYQAIQHGDVNQLQAAWYSSNAQAARYAAQAVREFPVSDRCQPSQIGRPSSLDSSGTSLSVLLRCPGLAEGQAYPAIFHFKADKTGALKISALQEADRSSLTQTGGVTVKYFTPDPVNTVYDFYDALSQQNCQEAARIRPDYKGCDSTEKVSFAKVNPLQIDPDKAAVQVDVTFKKKHASEEKFNGYILLQRSKEGFWLIQNLASADKMSAREFIVDFAGMKLKPLVDNAQAGLEFPNSPQMQPAHQAEGTTPAEVAATPSSAFGSGRILQALWGSEQLRGHPADKTIRPLIGNPDYSPPLRQYPRYTLPPLPAHLRGSIRSVRVADPDKKLVALTFDLCERTSEITGYDAEIVNYLRSQQVPATFYAGGKWMRSHPEQTKQLMADPLFEIGNHAWTHGNMRVLTGQEMQEQVLWTQAQYEVLRDDLAKDLRQRGIPPQEIDRIPPVPLSFRYPYGTCSQEALDFMGDQGLLSIQWNIVTADPWRKQTVDGIVKAVLDGIKPGSIVIAHANGRGWKTGEALPRLIPALRAKGYRFVTVSELLAQGKAVEAADSCYELRVGDNQFYDKKVGKGTD